MSYGKWFDTNRNIIQRDVSMCVPDSGQNLQFSKLRRRNCEIQREGGKTAKTRVKKDFDMINQGENNVKRVQKHLLLMVSLGPGCSGQSLKSHNAFLKQEKKNSALLELFSCYTNIRNSQTKTFTARLITLSFILYLHLTGL